MKEALYTLLKVFCLLSNLALIVIMCVLISNMQIAIQESENTPVFIITPKTSVKQQVIPTSKKPLTKDLNNIPKSDYKVPEIG